MPPPTPQLIQPPLSRWGHTWRIVLMVVISGVAWLSVAERQSERLFLLDVALALPMWVLVFWRRRAPLPVAIVTALASGVSSLAAGPAALAAVSLATSRRWRWIIPVALLSFAAAMVWPEVQPQPSDEPVWLNAAMNAVVCAALFGWGMYIGSRRELIWTLRQRAERAEAEQALRLEQARTNERSRIAREMHDVLAHRISQISLHAGALGYREDLSAEDMRASIGVIREKAHEALNDLRVVLGVLREGEHELAPQPTYADLAALVADARADGMNLDVVDEIDPAHPVPDSVGRTVYRIVQEGITNARKHAPATRLTVALRGAPGEGLRLELSNPLGFGTRTPGSGLGLVGLAERVGLAGGELTHGAESGRFVLRARIPWPA